MTSRRNHLSEVRTRVDLKEERRDLIQALEVESHQEVEVVSLPAAEVANLTTRDKGSDIFIN